MHSKISDLLLGLSCDLHATPMQVCLHAQTKTSHLGFSIFSSSDTLSIADHLDSGLSNHLFSWHRPSHQGGSGHPQYLFCLL